MQLASSSLPQRRVAIRFLRLLLACGLVSSLVYTASDVLGALSYPDYDYSAQAISEMSAIGAPTAGLLQPFYTAFAIVFIAFTAGVWRADSRPALRRTAVFLLCVAALGPAWSMFPMHMRGVERTFSDTMHLLLGGVTMILLSGAMLSSGAALGQRFRLYSLGSVAVMLIYFAATLIDVPSVAADTPTPYMGINERISMLAWLGWIGAFSVLLVRRSARSHVPANRMANQ
jgi:hypothetical protein